MRSIDVNDEEAWRLWTMLLLYLEVELYVFG